MPAQNTDSLDIRAARVIRLVTSSENDGTFTMVRRAGHIEVTEVTGRVIHADIKNLATGETFRGVTANDVRSALLSAARNVIINRDRAAA